MMRSAALTAAAVVWFASGAGSPARQSPPQPAQERLVLVEVAVLNADGTPRPGLGRDDFEIAVDGRPRPVEHVTAEDRPVSAVLLLDLSVSCWVPPAALKSAVQKHVFAHISPPDRVRLGTIGGGRSVLSADFAGQREALTSALRLLAPESVSTRGPSPIWDAVYAAAAALEPEPGRRAIVLVTDGRATGNAHGLDEAIARAIAAGASIHVVSEATEMLIQLGASTAARVRPGVLLKAMADETGGSYVSLSDVLQASRQKATISDQTGALLFGALEQAHRTYGLGFTAPALDNALQRLEVRVRQPGLTVRAPAGFVARKTPEP